jgi:hypothetical protein
MSRGQITTFCIVAFLVMAFGLVWVIFGKRQRSNLEHLRQTGYKATGVVVDYAYRRDSDGDSVPYPVVQFQGPDGRLITAESDFGGSFIPDKGDEVPVLFDPSRPEKVHLEYAMSNRAPTIVQAIGWVIMGGSAIALLVALLLYFVFWDAIWGPR